MSKIADTTWSPPPGEPTSQQLFTFLADPEDHDPRNPANRPQGVWGNVWADLPFWVPEIVRSHYARGDSCIDRYEHTEEIIGELAIALFGSAFRDDPERRSKAWSIIVVETLRRGSPLKVRLWPHWVGFDPGHPDYDNFTADWRHRGSH